MKRRLSTSLEPMEALSVSEIPKGPQWQYEPKWDGFRCLVFRRGSKVQLQSKSGQPLSRYFPELVETIAKLKADDFVLDGEIVIPIGNRLSFDDLLMRIHPAKTRIQKLSKETPAILILFDCLQEAKHGTLTQLPLETRRKHLESFAKRYLKSTEQIFLSPATRDLKVAKRWFASAGTAIDGIIAKRIDLEYRSGDRTGMQKIKPTQTADCVVGGFRYAANEHVVGSLLLGLYDDDGKLHHVGFTSSFSKAERKKLLVIVEPLIQSPGFTGKAPGGPSRWSTKRSSEWQPLKPKLVVEVAFDHFTGGRFRHGTTLLRWRPDKTPRKCLMDQVKQGGSASLKLLRKIP
jgi:ATP-dependent DNA ligase